MTSNHSQAPSEPRDGRTWQVLIVARISTEHQDARSLNEQVLYCENYLADHYNGPIEITKITSRGSGELLGTAELTELEAKIESKQFDLVITEDLGRICRRIQAIVICEACIDHGVQLIAINDRLDTADERWMLNAFFAAMHHQLSNHDTSSRISRTSRGRFSNEGGMLPCLIFGYVKPLGAKTDDQLEKDPAATPIYDEWFRRLEDGATYAEIADWLNANGIPTGPYHRSARWTGRMVRAVTLNTLLKGLRYRNKRRSKRINSTGQHKSIKAPPEMLLERDCPHLAHIEPERYDRVLHLLKKRSGGRGRKAGPQKYARKRSRWPGDHMTCGICGWPLYWGGHGQPTRMMCSGAREYACWNGATCDGIEACEAIIAAFLNAAESLPDWDRELSRTLHEKVAQEQGSRASDRASLERTLATVSLKVSRLADELAERGGSEILRRKIDELEAQQKDLRFELQEIDRRPAVPATLPPVAEIKQLARAAMAAMAADDPKFGRLMKRLIPRLEVYPVRPIDGGKVRLRVSMTVELAAVAKGALPEAAADLLRRDITVDLFEPPQRIAVLAEVCRLRAEGCTEQEAARRLSVTVTAAQRAMALKRMMDDIGVSEPYERLSEPPEDDGKMRRHRHARYSFRPLPHKQPQQATESTELEPEPLPDEPATQEAA